MFDLATTVLPAVSFPDITVAGAVTRDRVTVDGVGYMTTTVNFDWHVE